MDNENKITLNVGGIRFETNKTTLKKIPATRLSRLTEALANYDKILNEYFFDRHPGVFSQILNYYRTGKLHYPTNVCGPCFESELEFWGLDLNQVEPCCWKTYTKHRDTEETLATLERLGIHEDRSSDADLAKLFHLDEDPNWQTQMPWHRRIKPLIWQLMNESNSSKTAKAITAISIMFITISILTFCLGTMTRFCETDFLCRSYNIRLAMPHKTNEMPVIHLTLNRSYPSPTLLDYLDYVCITWFTLEFVLSFTVAPNKIKFFKSIINWIDLIANLWFYIDFVYNSFLLRENLEANPAWEMLGTVRILRLFKFFNHYAGLKVIIASLRASAEILRQMVFFVIVAVIIFASLIFYSEKISAGSDGRNGMSSVTGSLYSQHTNENQFLSILEAIWFSIASLTTVGFGDICPKTPLGMIFGAMCTVAGVLMIDLPMPIIVENFANYYNHLQASSKFPKKLRRKVLPAEAPRRATAVKFQKPVLLALASTNIAIARANSTVSNENKEIMSILLKKNKLEESIK